MVCLQDPLKYIKHFHCVFASEPQKSEVIHDHPYYSNTETGSAVGLVV